MVDGVTSTTTSGTILQSDAAKQSLFADMDTFLTLLITQLQNQDPLDPMDSAEFTNQLVQYAAVEQAIQTNANLETLNGLTVAGLATTSANYLDQWVEVPTDAISLQDGESLFSYYLPVEAASCKITITSADKTETHLTIDTATAMGVHKVWWDGTNEYGKKLDDGAYRVSISAYDAEGNLITQRNSAGQVLYDSNNQTVPLVPNAIGRVTAYGTDPSSGLTQILMGNSSVYAHDIIGVFSNRPTEEAIKIGNWPSDGDGDGGDDDDSGGTP